MCLWYIWETRRDRRYKAEDEDLEKGVDDMEADIMKMMRKRTMSKKGTWNEKVDKVSVVVPDLNGGGVRMAPGGGIHFPGSQRPHRRADALTEENTGDGAGDGASSVVNGNGVITKPKVRIAALEKKGE